MSKNKKLVIVDLFCGAGGFSTAAIREAKNLGQEVHKFVAVNHWDYAIATHTKNHPSVKHMLEAVDAVDPKLVIPGKHKRVDLLLASPECTHHSNAAGDRPINDQSRVTAWGIPKWCQEVYVDAFIIENVQEFLNWGPLGADMRPLKSKRGSTFKSFIDTFKNMGYRVEWKVLNCADYGDPTSRERLFIMGRRDRKPIVWPEASHASPKAIAKPQMDLWSTHKRQPWHTAREIIDWTIPGKSIFNREAEGLKPLSPNTMNRIFVGLRKYGLKAFTTASSGPTGTARPKDVNEPLNTVTADSRLGIARPYIIKLYGNSDAASVDVPMPTITAESQHLGLAQAFVLGQQSGAHLRSVDEPLPTIATAGAIGLAMPQFMVNSGGPEVAPRSVDEPMNTILTREHMGLVQPYLVPANHGKDNRTYPVDEPMHTITGLNGNGIAQPYVLAIDQSGSRSDQVYSVDDPIRTITTKNRFGVVQPEPFMTVYHGSNRPNGERTASVDAPFPTVSSGGIQFGLCQPYLVIYNGTSIGASIDSPFPTVTATERMALAWPIVVENGKTGYLLLDIKYRMFEPHELAAAMSFPRGYRFVAPVGQKISKRNKVRMIGNAVPGLTAGRLIRTQLSQLAN